MKKSILPVLLLMVGIAAASFLARELHRLQFGINSNRALTSRTPVAGFQKLLSDLQWIQFIQYCGTTPHWDEAHAEEIFRRTDRMLALDPDFTQAYESGAMMLYVQNPDHALQLLDRAVENPNLSSNWKLPFLAGFVAIRYETDDPQARQRWVRRSLGYFQTAYERDHGRTPYVLNHLIRAKAKLDTERPLAMAELKAWHDLYQHRTHRQGLDDGFEERGVDLLENLIASGRRCREELPDHPEARALTDRILTELQANHHLCFACFSPYRAGDQFCRSCGRGVKPFGMCAGCERVLEDRPAFCPGCGEKQAR